MTDRISVCVVAEAADATERVRRALAAVADGDVTVVERDASAVESDASALDCVVAVTPQSDADWERLADRGTLPLVVLAAPDEAAAVRRRAEEGGVTDVVVTDEDRFAALANRVLGVVRGRRSMEDPGSAADTGPDGRYLRDLYDVATDETLTFEEKADRILGIGLDRLGVENAHFSTIDREPERYEVVASVGELPIEPGELLELPETFCRRTIQSEEVLTIAHAAEEGWVGDPAYEATGVECYLGARITVGGSLYGTVCFMDRSAHPSFDEAERAFVSLVARWLSHELERARREDALDRLHDGTADLLRARTATAVCETATEVTATVLDAPRSRVWLVDDEAGTTLRPAASHGCSDDPGRIDRSDDRGEKLWTALDTGETGRYGGLSEQESDRDSDGDRTPSGNPGELDGCGFGSLTRSALVTPLGTEGVLVAGSETVDAFDGIDRSMAGMLGSNVVAALDRTDWIEQLQGARERFRRIFESASDGLLLVDDEADEIVDCNDRICELLGYDRAALRTIAPSTICRDDLDAFRRLLDRTHDNGRARADELVCRTGDGGHVPVAVSAAALELDGEEYVLASLRDVRDRKRREQALSVFNRVLRHNIRNDMNVIVGRASILEASLDDEDDLTHLARIMETARNLADLGEKARTFGQLDERDPDADSVELGPFVDRVGESLVEEYPDATVTVRGDREAVAAVDPTLDVAVRELLENAIKHARTDEPTVDVAITRAADGVTVRIADEGPGLPDQDHAVLEGGLETPLDHGSGLGLWLADWVVTAAGGSISVLEADADGTVIELSLPVGTDASRDR
ncbi:hypothetical protein BV210_02185 [Halorientalis sp. IM1011]|uniref:ATP-binding protein n=1 Tax=Halorientalis sp. IM1011 TaxID=1932360 RepID=UPI00097CC0BB|nr:ATP-binding protein [Halorientalis sp. IM1011]AQL41594.1 hypothetical protein BV210_02185 [Halorientalis sp. IM1011]